MVVFYNQSCYPVSKLMLKHVGVKTGQGEVVLLFPKSADGVTQEFEGLSSNKHLEVYVGVVICSVLVFYSLGQDLYRIHVQSFSTTQGTCQRTQPWQAIPFFPCS